MSRRFVNADGGDQKIDLAPITLRSNSAYSLIFVFISPDNASGNNWTSLYDESGSFPIANNFLMKQSGSIEWSDRGTDSTLVLTATAAELDNDTLHWIFAVKRTNSDRSIWVDGANEVTNTSTVDPTGTSTLWRVGNAGGGGVLPDGGRVARVIRLPGVALSLAEARQLAFYGPGSRRYRDGTWYELTGAPQEPELWGGVPGVVTGSTPGGNLAIRDIVAPSVIPRLVTFVPPAAAITGRIMSSLAYRGGLAGKGGIAGIGGGLAA